MAYYCQTLKGIKSRVPRCALCLEEKGDWQAGLCGNKRNPVRGRTIRKFMTEIRITDDEIMKQK